MYSFFINRETDLLLILACVISTKSLETRPVFGHVRPVKALLQPVVVESNGIGQVVGSNRSHSTVQVYFPDVIAVGEQDRWSDA